MIAITNVLGELVEKYRYTAFGLLTVLDAEGEEKDGDALSPWLYHGRLFEEASGLYWMRMRHYSPDLGRFLQPDPAGIAGGINLYAYSNNNPLRYFDPWGLWPAPDASGGDDGKYGEMNSSRYRRISRWIHGLLSAAGVVPLLGVIPDAVDLIYTLAELPSGHSSGSDAALAALGVGATFAPGAGDGAAAAAKIANRALDAGEVIAKNVDVAAGKIDDVGGLNLFKWGKETTTTSEGWKTGDRMLHLPDQGTAQLNWKQNSGALRREMNSNQPIFDSYRNPATGEQISTGGFLNAERQLLESRGWHYNSSTGAYHPPSG